MKKNEFIVINDNRKIPGVLKEKDGVHFGLYAAGTEVPVLILYEAGSKDVAAEIPFPENEMGDGFYSMKVRIPLAAYEYNFKAGTKVFTDPRACRLTGRNVFGLIPEEDPNSVRGAFSYRQFDWKGDRLPQISWNEAVMYHLHVRGFTMQKNSGVRHKGTFQGLKQKLPYLKELGINQLKLMPVYDFNEMEVTHTYAGSGTSIVKSWKMNYWGYGSAYYFAPKASYAAGSDPVFELKELVRSSHREGIEIILEFCFSEDQNISLITDCLTYWADEYHIDGFSVIARQSVLDELSALPLFAKRKLVATWYPDHVKERNAKKTRHCIAESNDGFMNECRRALRGDEEFLAAFEYRIKANSPACPQINYMANHDGFTMADMVTYEQKMNLENGEQNRDGTDYNCSWNCGEEGPSKKKSVRQLRLQQQKNAFSMLLFSQGVPMLLAGDEFSNSQNGNNNPYCHDSELTWLNWGQMRSNKELFLFVKEAIAFRRKQNVLHQNRELLCTDQLSTGFPDLSYHCEQAWYGLTTKNRKYVGCMYSKKYVQEDGFIYIAYNFSQNEQAFALPKMLKDMCWQKVMDTSLKESFLSEPERLCEDVRTVEAAPHSILVLEGK